MLRRSPHIFYFIVPSYDRGAKSPRGSQTGTSSAGGLPNFLRRKSTTKYLDSTTMAQFKTDRVTRFSDPFSLTLRNLANDRKTSYAAKRTLVGPRGKIKATRLVDSLLRNPKVLDWQAPWFDRVTNHQKKHNRSKTRHVEEVGSGAEDHYVSGLESYDVAAFEFCHATAPRWPFVQRWVGDAMKWWCEPVFSCPSSAGGSNSSRNSADSDLVRAISYCCEDYIDNEAILQRHIPRCLVSPRQLESLKSRTFSAVLQGYACSGARAAPAVEQAVLKGVGEHLVALHSPPSQLLSVLLQTLCIGIVRHQSYADFSRLGLVEVGRACSVQVARDKLPASVALSMRQILRKDADAAVFLAYAACIYCSPPASAASAASSSSSTRLSIPGCAIDFNGNFLSKEVLSSHPPSQPFLTLSLSWGFSASDVASADGNSEDGSDQTNINVDRRRNTRRPFHQRIQRVSSAAWLLELAVTAFSSLVDCSIPCGSPSRVLQSMNLVTASCEAWCRLMETASSSVSSDDLLSSSAVLIHVARLAPILEQLEFVEREREKEAARNKFLLLDKGRVDDCSAVPDRHQGEDAPIEQQQQQQQPQEAEPKTETKRASATSFAQNQHQQQSHIPPTEMYPTSYRADRVRIRSSNTGQLDENHLRQERENAEAIATTRFADAVRRSVSLALDQIGPALGVTKTLRLEPGAALTTTTTTTTVEKGDGSQGATSSSVSVDAAKTSDEEETQRVPRHVIAELADSLQFISACGVFRAEERDFARRVGESASQVALSE